MEATMRVDGLAEIERNMFRLGHRINKRIGRKVLKGAGEPVARLMRSLAPERFGDLKESIDVSSMLSRGAKASHVKTSDVEMFIGPGALAQAIQSEFGNYKQDAEPFAGPAWEAEALATLDRIGTLLWIEVEKAIIRQDRRAARAGA